jgi:hypothetical protein
VAGTHQAVLALTVTAPLASLVSGPEVMGGRDIGETRQKPRDVLLILSLLKMTYILSPSNPFKMASFDDRGISSIDLGRV